MCIIVIGNDLPKHTLSIKGGFVRTIQNNAQYVLCLIIYTEINSRFIFVEIVLI